MDITQEERVFWRADRQLRVARERLRATPKDDPAYPELEAKVDRLQDECWKLHDKMWGPPRE